MTLSSCEGNVLASDLGTSFDDGNGPVVETLCLEDAVDGLIVEVGGGEFPEDISWSLSFPSGKLESGIAGLRKIGSCACEFYTVELYDSYGDG